MRISMPAQSWLSVPPAPACTSRKASLASASPESSASSSRRATSARSRFSAASASATVFSSFSLSPSSIMVSWSSSSRSMRPSALRLSSSASRSRMTRWARAWSFHRPGSSASLFSSARRRCAVSTSKMPPQQEHRLLDLFDEFLGFSAHRKTLMEQTFPHVAFPAVSRNRTLCLYVFCCAERARRRSARSHAHRSALSRIEQPTRIQPAKQGQKHMGLFSKDIETLNDLFVHTLRDIYYAEKQIVKALPDMIEKATDSTLKQGFETHL